MIRTEVYGKVFQQLVKANGINGADAGTAESLEFAKWITEGDVAKRQAAALAFLTMIFVLDPDAVEHMEEAMSIAAVPVFKAELAVFPDGVPGPIAEPVATV